MSAVIPFARSSVFWTMMAIAAPLGLFMGFVTLVYIGAIDAVIEVIWGDDPEDTGLWSGHAWWIALMGAMGLAVGLMR